MALDIVAQPIDHLQAGGVLLGSEYQSGLGHLSKGLVDGIDILTTEVVMIAKRERRDLRLILLQIVHQLFGRGNTREQQDVPALDGLQTIQHSHVGLVLDDWAWRIVLQGGEEQLLIGIQIHGLGDDTELHGLEVLGALGDYHDIGTVLGLDGLAQTACGQQAIVDDQTMVIDQQDIDARLDITVLESIVEQYHIDIQTALVGCQVVDTTGALPIDSHGDTWELLLHLIGLVANHLHGGILVGQHEALALSLIATTEHGHVHMVLQQADEVLYMRGLSSTAHRDVTHRDDRRTERAALQDSHLEQQIPDADT